jgi:hypothetical protein
MTLNEKFENAPIVYDKDFSFTKDYESVADDFAISFYVFATDYKGDIERVKQLLQIYKKEQGL